MATAKIQRRLGNKKTGYSMVAVEWPGNMIYVYEASKIGQNNIDLIAMHNRRSRSNPSKSLTGTSVRQFINENIKVKHGWSYKYVKGQSNTTKVMNEVK